MEAKPRDVKQKHNVRTELPQNYFSSPYYLSKVNAAPEK